MKIREVEEKVRLCIGYSAGKNHFGDLAFTSSLNNINRGQLVIELNIAFSVELKLDAAKDWTTIQSVIDYMKTQVKVDDYQSGPASDIDVQYAARVVQLLHSATTALNDALQCTLCIEDPNLKNLSAQRLKDVVKGIEGKLLQHI